MAKSAVRRIISLETNEDGKTVAVELFSRGLGEKKKTDRLLKPLRRAQRQLARAQRAMAEEYLAQFDRSERKRRNGWFRDDAKNVRKAMRKGRKEIHLAKIF